MKNNNSAGWNIECSYCGLPPVFYAKVQPNKTAAPALVLLNEALAGALGLCTEQLQQSAGLFAGNETLGIDPIAQAYAGHQFGNFTMLGDGRALLLGEQLAPDGKRVDIQLKGSGRTPFSRGGDGRAGLAPMLREYLISEAMHGLGIPTTRSLAVAVTGETVYRETAQTGAVLTRTASSHLRVGTFQYAAARNVPEDLRALADYAIARHAPQCAEDADPYLVFLLNVIEKQAKLIAKWQLAGFIHGVMNTDNMTISGETIDYGPCAFMNAYKPETVFSSIDVQGRYSYRNQPGIGEWNISRFAETLLPLLHEEQNEAVKLAEQALQTYAAIYRGEWLSGMRAKLGLFNKEEEDEQLLTELLALMETAHADYTNTFRSLALGKEQPWFAAEAFRNWHRRWTARRERQAETIEQSAERMKQHNPSIIPRNHRVEEALQAAETGDMTLFSTLLAALQNPYDYTEQQEHYTEPPEDEKGYRTFCGT